MSKNVIILGAGGHAKVIADIIIKSGDNLLGFLDDDKNINEKVVGYPIFGKISDILKYKENNFFN
jgi:FlaA1/EpsC-like NDP-sugar epimerase